MKEAPGSSETSVLTRATRRNSPEDTILHERKWSTLMVHFIFLNVLEKTMKPHFRTVGVPAESPTGNVPNIRQKIYYIGQFDINWLRRDPFH
jgi:hypothetical protein